MRFRKVEHIKKMVRLTAGTLTDAGKKRTADNKGPPGWAERAAAKKAKDEAKATAKAARTAKAEIARGAAQAEEVVATTKRRGKPVSAAVTDSSVTTRKPATYKRNRSDPVEDTQVDSAPSVNHKRPRV